MFDAQTHLLVHRRRVRCPACGPRLQALPRLSPHARVTNRLAESVARLCKVLPIKHVAGHFGLGWDAVKAIDKAYFDRTLGPPDLDGLEQIAMDEVAIRKGHTYATVVVEPGSRGGCCGWDTGAWPRGRPQVLRAARPRPMRRPQGDRDGHEPRATSSHCRYPLNTSVLEGINNKIKVIKRMAYGFRDDAYFFLKIRSAFPGKAG